MQAPGVRVEVWFQDEARIGQKNSLTRVWGQTGSRPVAPKDLGFASAYLFGAVCPSQGKAAALIMTDLRKFLDTSVSSISGHIAGASYRAGEAGAQATAQSERTKPVLVANRFHAISQASMMSARLRNTELASQWLRR